MATGVRSALLLLGLSLSVGCDTRTIPGSLLDSDGIVGDRRLPDARSAPVACATAQQRLDGVLQPAPLLDAVVFDVARRRVANSWYYEDQCSARGYQLEFDLPTTSGDFDASRLAEPHLIFFVHGKRGCGDLGLAHALQGKLSGTVRIGDGTWPWLCFSLAFDSDTQPHRIELSGAVTVTPP